MRYSSRFGLGCGRGHTEEFFGAVRGESNTRDYVIQNVLEDGFRLYLEIGSLAWRGLCFEERRQEKAPTRDSRAPAGSLMPDFGRSDGAESPAGPSSDILMGIGVLAQQAQRWIMICERGNERYIRYPTAAI